MYGLKAITITAVGFGVFAAALPQGIAAMGCLSDDDCPGNQICSRPPLLGFASCVFGGLPPTNEKRSSFAQGMDGSCKSNDDCPGSQICRVSPFTGGSVCSASMLPEAGEKRSENPFELQSCETDDDCDDNYYCAETGLGKICDSGSGS